MALTYLYSVTAQAPSLRESVRYSIIYAVTTPLRSFCRYCGGHVKPRAKGPLPTICRKLQCQRMAARERQRRHRDKAKAA